MLKNSVRNWTPTRSVTCVVLNSAKSQLAIPAERRFGSRRLSEPNVKAAGWAKHDVLNHSFSRDWAEPEIDLSQPTVTFGLEPPLKELVTLTLVVNPRGRPLWKVETPLMPHPEISLPATPLTLPRKRCPLPMGRSCT